MALNLTDLTSNHYDYSVTSGTIIASSDIPTVSGDDTSADFDVSSILTCGTDFTNIDTSNFTIECWIKQKGITGDRIIFDKNGSDGTVYIQDNDTVVTQINGTSKTSVATITTTSWTHLAFAYNKAGGTMKIYQDGSLLETQSSHSTNGIPNNASFAKMQTPVGNGFYIDEYRVWSTERTITEIANNKNTKLNGNESGLVLYLTFDSGPSVFSMPLMTS